MANGTLSTKANGATFENQSILINLFVNYYYLFGYKFKDKWRCVTFVGNPNICMTYLANINFVRNVCPIILDMTHVVLHVEALYTIQTTIGIFFKADTYSVEITKMPKHGIGIIMKLQDDKVCYRN